MTKTMLILFFIGHLLGDFYFQSSNLATSKENSIKKLSIHSAIYLASMILVIIPAFSYQLLLSSVIISFFHFLIDLAKILIKRRGRLEAKWDVLIYISDQLVHAAVIFIVAGYLYFKSTPINFLDIIKRNLILFQINHIAVLSWALSLLLIIKPFSITISKALIHFKPEAEDGDENKNGYPNAGALIGIFERCIILLMLSVGEYAAIGFILTAKSIARYNKIIKEPRFSEYYLLGTLLSLLLVILLHLAVFN